MGNPVASSALTEPLRTLARLAETMATAGDTIHRVYLAYREALVAGNALIFAGNGGSAAIAQHLAAEYVVRFDRTRQPMRALALTTDTSVLTGAGNDLGFDRIYSRQIEAVVRAGDVVSLHSTSGRSANICRAAEAARQRKATVVGFVGGDGGDLAAYVDLLVTVPGSRISHIQELHLAIEHTIVDALERELGVPEEGAR